MNQTPTIPISNLSIGSIAKIPSLPHIGDITVLNSNSCGVRVKGTETLNDKTTSFDHTISCQTPVVLVGYNEDVAKENLAKQEKMRDIFGDGDKGFLAEDNKDNKTDDDKHSTKVENNDLEAQNNNMTDNNMEQQQNNNSEQNNQTTENSDSPNSFTQMTNSYTRPTGNFTAREFADLNNIQYNIALAYLKLNAKDKGKKTGGGRGRPTTLYSFD